MTIRPPSHGLVLAGLHSSSGKTVVSCLLLAGLKKRGIRVQPFKVGPDFLDPAYHGAYAGRPSRNLDLWLMGPDRVRGEAVTHGAGRVGVVEGVMGLFDGSEATSDAGSTMEVARLLRWPIVLVVPCAKVGRSLAAMLHGFVLAAGADRIRGVILNQVGGGSHADYLREAIAPLGLPVFGSVPASAELRWPERHLGLTARPESRHLPEPGVLGDLAGRFLDLEAIAAMVTPAPNPTLAPGMECGHAPAARPPLRLGLARDAAFHFYYQSNLDYLVNRGAELVPFSPLQDRCLPPSLDGIVLGGGFPECFGEMLAANEAFRSGLRAAVRDGLPCYAECGGLMLLAEALLTPDGRRFPMAGVLPGDVEMTPRLQHFGYCRASGLAGA
ncbi:MAG: cobyrinate a,c-diamide synthase, partial [Verrucomicrobia bacterium]|nr:cobyrinate a,c-diamide synthase [Verrucomicrobiota bacterium]